MENNWWAVEFDVPCSEPKPWHVHLAIAHNLLPTITAFEMKFKDGLWSFHRRMVENSNVLRFTFRFYSPRDVARGVYQAIQNNTILNQFQNEGLITIHNNPPEGDMEDQCIEAIAGTEKWPIETKKAWPYYINGVSKMWVKLIDEISRTMPEEQTSDIMERYRKIDERISEMWRKNGHHMLLHHLNALFGYKEIEIKGLNEKGEPVIFPYRF